MTCVAMCASDRQTVVEIMEERKWVNFETVSMMTKLMAGDIELVRKYMALEPFDTLSTLEVDFFLPQIAVLLVLWPTMRGHGLRNRILSTCAESLHCAMKYVWYFHAMAEYCIDNQEMKDRCYEMSRFCEVAVVNSRPDYQEDDDALDDEKSLLEFDKEAGERMVELLGSAALQKKIRSLFQRQGEIHSRINQLEDRILDYQESKGSEVVTIKKSMVEENNTTENEEQFSGETKNSGSSTERNLRLVNEKERMDAAIHHDELFAMYLSKARRSESFTNQLDFIRQLELISSKLAEQTKHLASGTRKATCKSLLRDLLSGLQPEIEKNRIFIPNRFGNAHHFHLLRIVAEESVPLSSREKAEICYTGKRCDDPGIYEDKDQDIDDEDFVREIRKKFRGRAESPLGRPFGELFHEKRERIRQASPYGHMRNWDLISFIVKAGDDCRQENLATQMIYQISQIFKEAGLPLWLKPFHLLVTSETSGIMEVVPDARSIDDLKNGIPNFQSLIWFYENHFGVRGTLEFHHAQMNFVQSMAAYSLVCYLLQIKDRHNGNIMIDAEGHVVHIDFGYLLSNSPGGNLGFEQAPFKLTQEFVEVMEGEDSEAFSLYKLLMIRGFLELRRHVEDLVSLAEILLQGPGMECFYTGQQCILDFKSRFYADKNEQDCIQFVYQMIEESVNNWRSVEYDRYQRITNGIL